MPDKSKVRRLIVCLVSCLLLSASDVQAFDGPDVLSGRIPQEKAANQTKFRWLNKQIGELVANGVIVGGQVSFRQEDKVLFTRCYGKVSQDSNRKVDDDTLFLIGSCSKPFASTCVFQLIGDKSIELNLDSQVDQWLPAFHSGQLKTGESVSRAPTIEELMAHRAGIFSQKKGMTRAEANWIRNFSLTLKESVEGIESSKRIAQPNEIYAYSGAGYCVLGRVAELASEQSIEELIQKRLCKPIGLKRTTYFPVSTFRDEEIASGVGNTPHQLGKEHRLPLIGGSLYSTANEMTQFGGAVLGQWHGDDNRLKIEPELIKQFGKSRSDSSEYSLGWKVLPRKNAAPRLSHSGALFSYRAFLAIDLETRVSVAGCWTLASKRNAPIAPKLIRLLDGFSSED